MDILLDEDRIAVTGPVLGELLRGFRRTEQADWVASRLRSAHYLEPSWDDWRNAAAFRSETSCQRARCAINRSGAFGSCATVGSLRLYVGSAL
jgi:hypothetical protein